MNQKPFTAGQQGPLADPVDDEKALGKQLQAARRRAGLTQQDLCNKAGLSYSTLAKIERGAIKSPSIFTIQQIARVLGTGLDELVGHSPASSANSKQQAKNGVRFVYFDINGTLLRFFHLAFAQLAEESGGRADAIEQTFWQYNDAVCRGEMGLDDFNGLMAKQLQVPKVNWLDYYLSAITPITETQELLHWVAEHYQVGLISNIMPGFIDALFERGLLPKLDYNVIIDSSKVGAIKPEPKIYELAQTQAGVPADEILLVDDGRPNIMAAAHLGWHVLWFDDYRPDVSVARIRETLEF